MARAEPITFHVPASTANLGPGYGVLAVALDLPLRITVEPRSDGEVVVERIDDPGASLDDPRHDPVLRGFRAGAERLEVSLQKGVSISVDGTIPRGTGLGTVSAGFAAGLGAAVRLARRKWTPGQILDLLVPLGGDPAHGAASLLGGCCATVLLSRPGHSPLQQQPLPFPIHQDWRFVVVMPDVQMGTADTKRVLPPTLPHAVTSRSVGRAIGLLTALGRGDEELLRACLVDEVHVPYRRRLVPGMEGALEAAVGAGAAGATVCGHGPGLVALTRTESRTAAIARAMVAAFAAAGRQATWLTLQTAHYGALPQQPSV